METKGLKMNTGKNKDNECKFSCSVKDRVEEKGKWPCGVCKKGVGNNSIFRLDALALSIIATATWLGGWLGGWLAVTLRYCIRTTKPIGKLFRPSESPIILVF